MSADDYRRGGKLDLDLIERLAWMVPPDVVLALVGRIRELERRYEFDPYGDAHDSSCMARIGKRGGYWDCDCGAMSDDRWVCSDCGGGGTGHHACEGRPGGLGDE